MDKNHNLRALGEYESLEDLIQKEIIRRVADAAPKVRYGVRAVKVEDIVERYCLCEPWRTEVADLFRRLRFKEPRMSDLERWLEYYWEALKAGEILDDIAEQDLFLLPLALQHHRQTLEDAAATGDTVSIAGTVSIPVRARMACILSLWHWSRKLRRPTSPAGASSLSPVPPALSPVEGSAPGDAP